METVEYILGLLLMTTLAMATDSLKLEFLSSLTCGVV